MIPKWHSFDPEKYKLWKEPNYLFSGVPHHDSAEPESRNKKKEEFLYKYFNRHHLTSRLPLCLSTGKEAAWTDGRSSREDDITVTRGSQSLPFMPAVCARLWVCVWEPLSLRVTSWERIGQEARVRADNKHSPHLHKEAFLPREQKKGRCVCVCVCVCVCLTHSCIHTAVGWCWFGVCVSLYCFHFF